LRLAVDDSAGAPLDSLPAGVFARLLAEAVAGDGDPACLLALRGESRSRASADDGLTRLYHLLKSRPHFFA